MGLMTLRTRCVGLVVHLDVIYDGIPLLQPLSASLVSMRASSVLSHLPTSNTLPLKRSPEKNQTPGVRKKNSWPTEGTN
jgi:hypothetical protein